MAFSTCAHVSFIFCSSVHAIFTNNLNLIQIHSFYFICTRMHLITNKIKMINLVVKYFTAIQIQYFYKVDNILFTILFDVNIQHYVDSTVDNQPIVPIYSIYGTSSKTLLAVHHFCSVCTERFNCCLGNCTCKHESNDVISKKMHVISSFV